MVDHSPAFACLPMHRLPSLEDWAVWADWLIAHDPEPWRDHRIHKRIVRGDPNNVHVDRLSMSQAYCPGQVAGVFEWADYSIALTEFGWVYGPVCPFPRFRYERGLDLYTSYWGGPDTIYVSPATYRRFREDRRIATNDVEAHIGRLKQARNPRRRTDRGEHNRGRRRT